MEKRPRVTDELLVLVMRRCKQFLYHLHVFFESDPSYSRSSGGLAILLVKEVRRGR